MRVKAKFIFGEEATRHYDDTGRAPSERTLATTGGLVFTKEFPSKELYDSFVEALEMSNGHYDWRRIKYEEIPEKEPEAKVVCACCGGTRVSCQGIVGPNTKEFQNFVDGAFYDGQCMHCGNVVLTAPAEVGADIDKLYKEHVAKTGLAPLYALCKVVHTDREPTDGFESEQVNIKLSLKNIPGQDGRVFAFCNGVEELKTYSVPTENNPFTLIEINCFSTVKL